MDSLSNEILHTPSYSKLNTNSGVQIFIDPEGPNWISTDNKGAKILSFIDGKKTFDEVVRLYSTEQNLPFAKAWVDVDSFIKDGVREKFISLNPYSRAPYKGRANYLELSHLSELWIHTNNSCNLQCTHCLVESGPSGDKGLDTQTLKKLIDDAKKLGVYRFYFTGGEPFIRKDIFELIDYITIDPNTELIILTNGMFFNHKDNLNEFLAVWRGRVKPQISLDGSTAKANDSIRGKGTFKKIIEGIKSAVKSDLEPTVTTVVNSCNLHDITNITRLIHKLGVNNHHLLWVHQRGRISQNNNNMVVPTYKLIEVIRETKLVADELGIKIDNFESVKTKLKAKKFTKYDLSNACWESLCVYSDGGVYPSAAFANYPGLSGGNILNQSLEKIWKYSPIFNKFRSATVQNKTKCNDCYLKYICGGGDIEHTYFYTASTFGKGDIEGLDPYSELHEYIIITSLYELAVESAKKFNKVSGFDSPVIHKSMGDESLSCNINAKLNGNGNNNVHSQNGYYKNHNYSDFIIEISHSNCVLTYDLDKSRESVRNFYSKAADQPQKDLCCPTSYPLDDTSHIPQEVIDRFYGCGSPMNIADIKDGEVVTDLGSGAGIDCFIASKKVGPEGKVFGIDMTDNMLKIANKCKQTVSENLGYSNVEFKKGFLEQIPLDDDTVDLITSNCVINLSPNKKSVFSEMWRILSDHGRIVISDIVSENEVPPHIINNQQLWGECIAGALTEEQFISYLEQSGFYGIQILSKTYWKTIESYRFYSLSVRAYKFRKKAGCVYIGQKAIYHGPFKATVDEEGHIFPRGEAVQVCTDTAQKLSNHPYNSFFTITDPTNKAAEDFTCGNDSLTGCC
ncbi:MAG: methyltransferase domain-containing protein [Candidatus Dadabacteria bacterium]|nr:methyltransferase domain-containing protein [Candidatus Dadabacteria bacterium]